MSEHLLNTYSPLPVTFERGDGVWLWDTEGKQYLDALTGIAVCALGHNHPKITQTIKDQAEKLLQTSNVYHIAHQEALADKLCAMGDMDGVFFGNSGAEANECAIKLCRLYGHSKDINEPTIIVMEKSFHGRTLATLTATGNRKAHAGFEPLVKGFARAPYNDIEILKTMASNDPNIVAVMLEPIQGEGGINIPDEGYLKAIRQVCDDNGWLMVLDEIQTGMGRTGKFFAFQHEQIKPDIATLAKALGNGIPIGACLTQGRATELFQPGSHGSTFGGNPFSTRVALSVLETLEADNLIQQAADSGQALMQGLQQRLEGHPHVVNIRGKGLIIGIELDQPCRPLLQYGLKHGLLFSVTADKVIRLLPSYILSVAHIADLVDRLVTCIDDFYADNTTT